MKYTIQEMAIQAEIAHWKHYIKIGVKDYFRTIWHDWLIKRINRFEECRVMAASYKGNDRKKVYWILKDTTWKKGGILYYIRNAKAIYERKRISYEFVQRNKGK